MIISPLQKYEPKDWSGLTTKNHLGAMFGEMPILISDVLDNIFDVNLGLDLDRFADQFPTLDIDKDSPFEWLLNSQSAFKNIPLINYYDSTLAAQPAKAGIGGSIFYLEFPDRIFEAIDIISPANYGKEKYLLKITAAPTPNGSNWVYPVKLTSGDLTLFVPTSMLTGGVRWVKMFAPVEQTLSQRGSSSINHSSPLRMANRCTMIRAEYTVPGNII